MGFANAILGGSKNRLQLVVDVKKTVAWRQRPEMHNEMSGQSALAMKHKKYKLYISSPSCSAFIQSLH